MVSNISILLVLLSSVWDRGKTRSQKDQNNWGCQGGNGGWGVQKGFVSPQFHNSSPKHRQNRAKMRDQTNRRERERKREQLDEFI